MRCQWVKPGWDGPRLDGWVAGAPFGRGARPHPPFNALVVLNGHERVALVAGLMDELAQPGVLGAVRVGDLDMNRSRIRAVMEAIPGLPPNPCGSTSSDLAARGRCLLADEAYSPGPAAYDLRKLR